MYKFNSLGQNNKNYRKKVQIQWIGSNIDNPSEVNIQWIENKD